jgi:hypothetical protein
VGVSELRLPLRRLDAASGCDAAAAGTGSADQVAPSRRLDLEPGELRPWLDAVRSSEDACLLLDADARVAAVSGRAGVLLDLDDDCVGRDLATLVRAIDFSSHARPDPDQQRALPPVVALDSGHTARGLLRLRHRDAALVTLDVVSTPLARGAGVLSFLHPV